MSKVFKNTYFNNYEIKIIKKKSLFIRIIKKRDFIEFIGFSN